MLLDRDGRKDDVWQRGVAVTTDGAGFSLLQWEDWGDHASSANDRDRLGVEVPATLSIETLAPVLDRVGLVAVRFGAFSDGRGLSLARLIRRAGFKGVLRAVGPLIPDEFAYALQCGFDEIELPDSSAQRQTEQEWIKARVAYTAAYQRGYIGETSILDRRRQGRLPQGGSDV